MDTRARQISKPADISCRTSGHVCRNAITSSCSASRHNHFSDVWETYCWLYYVSLHHLCVIFITSAWHVENLCIFHLKKKLQRIKLHFCIIFQWDILHQFSWNSRTFAKEQFYVWELNVWPQVDLYIKPVGFSFVFIVVSEPKHPFPTGLEVVCKTLDIR